MTSVVSIYNRALQKLGAERVTAVDEDSRNARSCTACYETLRDALMRDQAWNFSTKRVALSPLAEAPPFDYLYQFQLPSDYLIIRHPNTQNLDWQIENGKLLTNDGPTLNLIYAARIVDPNEFDNMFKEVLVCRMAMEMCEELTQSDAKFQRVAQQYKDAMSAAKKNNAFETLPTDMPEDTWITARY